MTASSVDSPVGASSVTASSVTASSVTASSVDSPAAVEPRGVTGSGSPLRARSQASTAARYAFPNVELQTPVGSVQESWYVKAYLELGVFGLAIALAFLGTLVYRAARVHLRIRDPRLKFVSAAILALMAWVLVYSIKAQYFDLDPINLYTELRDAGALTPVTVE